jgi:hypothetical protein
MVGGRGGTRGRGQGRGIVRGADSAIGRRSAKLRSTSASEITNVLEHYHVEIADKQQKYFVCLSCETAVEDDDSYVQCHDCKQFCHFKCSKLTKSIFDVLVESDDSCQWLCEICRSGEGVKRDARDDKLDHLIMKVDIMAQKMTMLETGYTGASLDEKIERAVQRKLAEALDERGEIEKRKLNVVVVGVKESEAAKAEDRAKEDVLRVKALIARIDPNLQDEKVENPVRLGRAPNKDGKPRLLKIQVGSEEARDNIVRNAWKLNQQVKDPKDRVYFNQDLTQLQRERQKELKAELLRVRAETGEGDWVIRNGKIVKKRAQAAAAGGGQVGNDR